MSVQPVTAFTVCHHCYWLCTDFSQAFGLDKFTGGDRGYEPETIELSDVRDGRNLKVRQKIDELQHECRKVSDVDD